MPERKRFFSTDAFPKQAGRKSCQSAIPNQTSASSLFCYLALVRLPATAAATFGSCSHKCDLAKPIPPLCSSAPPHTVNKTVIFGSCDVSLNW